MQPRRERYVSPGMATFEPLNARHRRQSELDGRLAPSVVNYRDMPETKEPEQQGFTLRGAQPLSAPPTVPVGGDLEMDIDEEGTVFAQRSMREDDEDKIARREGEGGYFSSLRVIGQFKRQYIVCEDANAMVVIDQHAAHERIGYERLKKIFATEHKENQPLLFPKRIDLDAIRAEVLGENIDFFEQAGFEIEHFGGQTYVLKSVPAIFAKGNIDRIVREAIDDLAYHGRTDRMDEAMDAILSRMACHSVVRGPTTLTNEECYALFEQMDSIDFAANCPHGRPVYWRMELKELEESFERR
jgi:DNA mismatch repair protein MutL